MDTARIAALLEPFLEHPLSPLQLQHISMYINLLFRWNERINLTAIRNPDEIVTRHFGESLFLARHLFPATPPNPNSTAPVSGEDHPMSVLDIGSGAGFPGLPLKIWAPRIYLTLVESNHKKVAFLREVARALILTDINVSAVRLQTLTSQPNPPRAQVVTLRAVEGFEAILASAIPLLAPQGRLALLIGQSQIPRLPFQNSLQWHPPIPLPQSDKRVLSIGIRL